MAPLLSLCTIIFSKNLQRYQNGKTASTEAAVDKTAET